MMQRAAHAYAIHLTLGETFSPSISLGLALIFAVQWLAACLLSALLYRALIVWVFQRRTRLQATNRGTLYVACFLLPFGAGALFVGSRTLALRAPLVGALVPILFLLFFYLFSDERYAPRWTRWLGIIPTFSFLGPFWSEQQSTNPAALTLSHVPGLLGVLETLGNCFAVLPIVVGILPQIYYRYRHFVLTGERRQLQQRTGMLICGALALACFLGLIAEGALALAAQTSAPVALYAETGFSLLVALIPVAASFTLLHRRFYDREAVLNRLLISGLLTLCLLVIYAGSILVLWFFFPGFAGLAHFVYIPFFIVIALLMAMTFRPLRAQLQERIDRRFFRRTYAARQRITAFTSTLREATPLDMLSNQLIAVIQKALLPASVMLWLQTSSGTTASRRPGNTSVARSIGHPHQQTGTAEIHLHRQIETGVSQLVPAVLTITPDDPALAALLRPASVLELDRQPAHSAVMDLLRAAEMALALPFVIQGELVGVLGLGPRLPVLPGRRYTFDDRELLALLAEQVTPVLHLAQRAHMQEIEDRQRERIEQELQTARRIQEALLPKAVPMLSGWQIATCYQPAREVGGDFYDFFSLADGRLGIVLGDVTDKGIPAALVMATTRSMLRAIAVQSTTSPGQVLAQVNELLHADLPANMFVTCFYAILDPATGRLHYANAGQDLPYLRHADGAVEELRARGMPLGLMPGMPYEEQETTLVPGDSLLFYSDGLVEAHNSKREMFGFPRLRARLCESANAASPIPFLLHALTTFTGPDWEQEDDLTLVVLQRAEDAAGNLSSNG